MMMGMMIGKHWVEVLVLMWPSLVNSEIQSLVVIVVAVGVPFHVVLPFQVVK